MRLFIYQIAPMTLLSIVLTSCSTPLQSQKYFAQAVKNDPIMEPLHQTALYTVYFDHALQRCVLHSSYTWGESGGGTGGTGLGVSVFSCNPQALKAHADRLREQIKSGTDYFELPVPKVRQTRPHTQQPSGGLTKPQRGLSIAPAQPQPATPTPQPATQPVQNSTAPAMTTPQVQPQPAHRGTPPQTAKPQPAPIQKTAPKPEPKKPATSAPMLQPITMP